MVRVTGQLDAPLLDVGAVKEDYWERKEILLPSLSRLFKPKGWRRFFYKTQAPKIVLQRLTDEDWHKIQSEFHNLNQELLKIKPKMTEVAAKAIAGEMLTQDEMIFINDADNRVKPIAFTMLTKMIIEPKMNYDDVAIMMDVIDQNDTDTLLSYVSIMTSEKARAMKLIYDKRMKESEMITQ